MFHMFTYCLLHVFWVNWLFYFFPCGEEGALRKNKFYSHSFFHLWRACWVWGKKLAEKEFQINVVSCPIMFGQDCMFQFFLKLLILLNFLLIFCCPYRMSQWIVSLWNYVFITRVWLNRTRRFICINTLFGWTLSGAGTFLGTILFVRHLCLSCNAVKWLNHRRDENSTRLTRNALDYETVNNPSNHSYTVPLSMSQLDSPQDALAQTWTKCFSTSTGLGISMICPNWKILSPINFKKERDLFKLGLYLGLGAC